MQRILFVCTGNTCRSPMAEAILRNRNLAQVEVRSAGVYAAVGSDASEHAKSVLKENEIHHEHTSKQLSEEDVKWATHILTMTASHKSVILHHFTEAAQKTFTLKEFAGSTLSADIGDPFGGNLNHYREAYREIEQNIDSAIERLRNEKTSGG